MFAALGIDPHQAATAEARPDRRASRAARPSRGSSPWGRPGSTAITAAGTLPEQRALFDAHLGLADELRLPVVIHSREASVETAAALAAFGGAVVLHCFSEPDLLEPALERGYYVSFAGQRHVSEGEPAPRGGGARSGGQDPRRDGQPVPRAPARARTAERAGERDAHARALAAVRGETAEELEARIDENATALFGLDRA